MQLCDLNQWHGHRFTFPRILHSLSHSHFPADCNDAGTECLVITEHLCVNTSTLSLTVRVADLHDNHVAVEID